MERKGLRWREDGDGLALCRGRAIVLRIVPAGEQLPGMWCIEHADGRRSDTANVAHCKDAARAIALRENVRETAGDGG